MNCCTSGLSSNSNDIKFSSRHRHQYAQYNNAFKFVHHNHLQYSNEIERVDKRCSLNPISFFEYARNQNDLRQNETVWILRDKIATSQQNNQQRELGRAYPYQSEFRYLNDDCEDKRMQSNPLSRPNFEPIDLSNQANTEKKSNSKCVHYAPILTQGKYNLNRISIIFYSLILALI
jgi:hypothetical protein